MKEFASKSDPQETKSKSEKARREKPASAPNSSLLDFSLSGAEPPPEGGDDGDDRSRRLQDSVFSRLPRTRGTAQTRIASAENEANALAAMVQGATPGAVKSSMGYRLGADFSEVVFHTDEATARRVDAMGTQAYAAGSDVFFGSGGFEASVAAHELVHTVQQGAVDGAGTSVSAPYGGIQMFDPPDKKSSDSPKKNPWEEMLKKRAEEEKARVPQRRDSVSALSSPVARDKFQSASATAKVNAGGSQLPPPPGKKSDVKADAPVAPAAADAPAKPAPQPAAKPAPQAPQSSAPKALERNALPSIGGVPGTMLPALLTDLQATGRGGVDKASADYQALSAALADYCAKRDGYFELKLPKAADYASQFKFVEEQQKVCVSYRTRLEDAAKKASDLQGLARACLESHHGFTVFSSSKRRRELVTMILNSTEADSEAIAQKIRDTDTSLWRLNKTLAEGKKAWSAQGTGASAGTQSGLRITRKREELMGLKAKTITPAQRAAQPQHTPGDMRSTGTMDKDSAIALIVGQLWGSFKDLKLAPESEKQKQQLMGDDKFQGVTLGQVTAQQQTRPGKIAESGGVDREALIQQQLSDFWKLSEKDGGAVSAMPVPQQSLFFGSLISMAVNLIADGIATMLENVYSSANIAAGLSSNGKVEALIAKLTREMNGTRDDKTKKSADLVVSVQNQVFHMSQGNPVTQFLHDEIGDTEAKKIIMSQAENLHIDYDALLGQYALSAQAELCSYAQCTADLRKEATEGASGSFLTIRAKGVYSEEFVSQYVADAGQQQMKDGFGAKVKLLKLSADPAMRQKQLQQLKSSFSTAQGKGDEQGVTPRQKEFLKYISGEDEKKIGEISGGSGLRTKMTGIISDFLATKDAKLDNVGDVVLNADQEKGTGKGPFEGDGYKKLISDSLARLDKNRKAGDTTPSKSKCDTEAAVIYSQLEDYLTNKVPIFNTQTVSGFISKGYDELLGAGVLQKQKKTSLRMEKDQPGAAGGEGITIDDVGLYSHFAGAATAGERDYFKFRLAKDTAMQGKALTQDEAPVFTALGYNFDYGLAGGGSDSMPMYPAIVRARKEKKELEEQLKTEKKKAQREELERQIHEKEQVGAAAGIKPTIGYGSYGSVHLLLKRDNVKDRCVYTATDHGKPRRDPMLTLYDFFDVESLTGKKVTAATATPFQVLGALVNAVREKNFNIVKDAMKFECQIYGNVRVDTDVEAIYCDKGTDDWKSVEDYLEKIGLKGKIRMVDTEQLYKDKTGTA